MSNTNNTNIANTNKNYTESFEKEYKKRKKSVIFAYYLCLMMSGFGLHKFYLGDKIQGFKFVALYWLGLVVFAAGFGLMEAGQFTFGASIFVMGMGALVVFGVWWVVDIVTLYFQTRRKNEIIKQQIMSHQS